MCMRLFIVVLFIRMKYWRYLNIISYGIWIYIINFFNMESIKMSDVSLSLFFWRVLIFGIMIEFLFSFKKFLN